ncbi:MAG TPA: hypothetical protein PLQ03_06330 [Brevundimonas sp.]|uniref:hypothetical protein n=1 Tax=Brevundimonas sp. TaxID=1871086 RepID=UPI00262E9C9B|nr:hypothetical protein [Brevundimonas sp.]HRO33013.1 hypothetical protein [Brevundimonas sp.]
MFDTLPAQIGAVFTVAVCLFAFLKGDEPERIGAGAYLLGWFASLLVQTDGDLYAVQWAMFALDTVMLVILGALAWRSRRSWPIWACALQLLAVTSHIMAMIDLRPPIASFYTVLNIASYGILLALAIGTFWAWQERRAAGLE